MKVRGVIKLIEAEGWQLDRQSGSHRQFTHLTRRGVTTVAGHPGDDVHPKTLGSIMKQAGIRRTSQ